MSGEMKTTNIILSAPIIYPVSDTPIFNGALLVCDGKICDIGDADEIRSKHPDIPTRKFDDSILLPGLINAHIHLEYSTLGHLEDPVDFIPWIKDLIRRQREFSNSEISSYVSNAISYLISSGTTSIAETSKSGLSFEGLLKSGLKGMILPEIVAVDSSRKKEALNNFKTIFEKYKYTLNADKLKLGMFPHSPYTLSYDVLTEIASLIKTEGVVCGIHAAESCDEKEFISSGLGTLADFVREFELDTIPESGRWVDTFDYLDSAGLLHDKTFLVHAVHIGDEHFALLKKRSVGIVICPRSNYMLNNGTFPLTTALKYDIKLGLGTDSLASNRSLDMFDEMRFLSDTIQPESTNITSHALNEKIIHIATLGGAQVLGADKDTGSLTIGKSADIIAVKVNGNAHKEKGFLAADYLVKEASSSNITLTMIDGSIVYDDS